ncbi:S-adenosyl-L-methionine-dependent methyltransferase [Staphylotrichum tortipilum]|uniref:S-adenosyl-L-methionine-dependent methyltransferase n=1 Tax=Staphylotrichum tortipilum TaxID=2831512 RepID=A0AAN6MNG8_9PEZI|nr:S-adenosyl-L-methionine-dependent methyltransferase [Staphylotrichum longicolle]
MPGDIQHKNGIPSSLELLARDLEEQVREFAGYLRANGLPEPAFGRDAPVASLPSRAPEDVLATRDKILENALQIFRLVSGPGEHLIHAMAGYQHMEILRWMNNFGIFELLPLHGSISYTDLAMKAGVSALRLKPLARMAMTDGIFEEPAPDFIAHSAASAAMVEHEGLRTSRIWSTSFHLPTIAAMVTAHKRWPHSTAPNETCFNAAQNTELPMYEYIARDGELSKLFERLMIHSAKRPSGSLGYLIDGFDWRKLANGTVVDIGGSTGHISIALATAFPSLSLIVQDISDVTEEGAKSVRENQPPEIASRITFQAHDFFTPQPVRGADVYLFRQIIHNWNADKAATILRNIVPAMGATSHIVMMDILLPEPGSIASVAERELRMYDIGMMQWFNGQERDLREWNEVLHAADPRLKIWEVKRPAGSCMSIIDVVLEE